jgi:hypothetical protein
MEKIKLKRKENLFLPPNPSFKGEQTEQWFTKNTTLLLPLFKGLGLILLFLNFQSLHLSAQNHLLNLSMKNVSLHEILMEIKKQSGKNIVFNNNLIDKYNNETIELKNAKLDDALKKVLEGKELQFKIVDDVIIIEPKTEKPNSDKTTGLFQKVKGTVFDIESNRPLIGATVVIMESSPIIGAATDLDGTFKLDKVPVGRHNIQISYVGYEPTVVSEVLVTSGKEVVINAGLKQSITQMKDVTVKAWSQKDKPLNTMASISARSFTVEEARRYAGGLDDPARLASSFAGVTMSSLTDNGIVIRGNSAKGVSWRLEGVDIPNPNHFAGANAAGGGIVTVFSSQMLANSDFYTGAFPAEYGNAISGVFDMKLRNGNSENREHTIQAGILGIDLASEGPFKEGSKATYLFNYRYSTFGLIKQVLPPNNGIPDYQDLSFKLNFPNKYGSVSVWGIGSNDNYPKPKMSDSTQWQTADDQTYFNWHLNMGAVGINHKLLLGENTYVNTTLAGTGTLNKMDEKRFDNNMAPQPNWLFEDNSSKIVLSSFINHKFNERNTFKTGFNFTTSFYNLNLNSTVNDVPSTFQNFVKENGTGYYWEYYAQSKYDITSNLTLFTGVNSMYFALNKDFSIDPRASIRWEFQPGHSFSFGFGKHSQLEELKIYMVNHVVNGNIEYPNKNLRLSHSLQYVFGYDWRINDNLHLKIEPYFQYLYNVPGIHDSSYSMINFVQDWTFRDSLANNSKGKNYGVDFTLERFLHDGYYFLITTSIFNSKYRADDGIWRNTIYNQSYVANLLYGKEFYMANNKILGINGKFTFMGGERYSPVDMAKSLQEKMVIFDESKAFSNQLPATKYLDLTITYQINKPRYSSMWALQIKNVLAMPMSNANFAYNYKTGKVTNDKIVVILPLLSYKIEF